jgi:hypothetical protein
MCAASRYLDRVNRMADPQPCEHGHFDCADKSGRCSNELAANCGCDDCEPDLDPVAVRG